MYIIITDDLAEVESVGPHMKYSVEGHEDDDDDDHGDDDLVRVGVHHTARAGQLRILEVLAAVTRVTRVTRGSHLRED